MRFPILMVFLFITLFCVYVRGLYLSNEKDGQKYDITTLFSSKCVDWKEINRTISFVHSVNDRMKTLETNLGYSEMTIQLGTSPHGQFVDSFPEPEASKMMRLSVEAVAASMHIADSSCSAESLTVEECGNRLKHIKLWNTDLRDSCQMLGKECTKELVYSKYRSLDSSCNNEDKGEKGQSFTAYGRLLYPKYLGGISLPRRSITKYVLPSARAVSSSLRMNGAADTKRSLAVLFWGQFVEHDLAHTAMRKMVHTEKPIVCCGSDGWNLHPRYEHPFCMPIVVPPKDEYYSQKHIHCISYVRSQPVVGPDCSMGPMEQLNQATHFLDGSQIYGTTKTKSDILRSFTGGFLKVDISNNQTLLPCSKDPQNDCQQSYFNAPCYQAGDKRVNTDPHMAALYTIWVKEHNRIASQLGAMNPSWDDEIIFQEARRIVIAEIQHITYNEWIPVVLGTKIETEYKPSTDPEISNEFATAAIRTLQSATVGKLSLKDEEEKYMYEFKNMDTLLEEMVKKEFSGRSLYYIGKLNDITYGYDILSLDIQRGRDHGLQTYNAYRRYCGLKGLQSFKNLEAVMLPQFFQAIKKNYRNVEDIDLIVGGLGEQPEGDGMFGPTINCILNDQFERTRSSDRYFYTNKQQPMPFSESQLGEIKKVTLARIICDNSENIEKISPRVFERSDVQIPCDSIPRINLTPWSNDRLTYTVSS